MFIKWEVETKFEVRCVHMYMVVILTLPLYREPLSSSLPTTPSLPPSPVLFIAVTEMGVKGGVMFMSLRGFPAISAV